MPSLTRRLTAEALGTFGLVFVGAAVVVVNGGFPNSGIGLIGIAFAHATVLSIMITSTMTISGGHLNPAVTISLLLGRRIDPLSAAAYVAVQLAAACLAAFLVKLLLPAPAVRGAMLGVPVIASSVSLGPAVISGEWVGQLVYWIGPIAGALLAAVLWEFLLLPKAPNRRRKTD
jgi:glycerol uptake facilitator-like aquaporin